MKLGLDLDGCAADFVGGWTAAYEQWWPGRLDLSKLDEWNGIVTGTHFENEEDFWKWSDTASIWKRLPVVPGAQGALYDLEQAGFDIQFVTSRHEKTWYSTQEWIANHFPFLVSKAPFIKDLVVFAGKDKSVVGADIYLDDSPHVLNDLRLKGCTTVRYKRPWNKGVISTMTVTNWEQFKDYALKIQEVLK